MNISFIVSILGVVGQRYSNIINRGCGNALFWKTVDSSKQGMAESQPQVRTEVST